MNREMLYEAVGNIDDDLILTAQEAHGRPVRKPVFFVAGLAACLCLILGSVLFTLQGDALHVNTLPTPTVSKVVVPVGGDTQIVPVSYAALLAYYGIPQLPDTLGGELARETQSYFTLYQDPAGSVLYDKNIFYFSSPDKSVTLSATLGKASENTHTSQEARLSRISGVSVLLAASPDTTDIPTYWAEFQLDDLSVQLVAAGLAEDAFVDVVTEFIRALK